MRRLKLFVFLFFLLFSATFFGHRLTTPVAGGQVGPLSAPTGVKASDGDYANKVVIMWDTMRGAALYRIYRNTTNNPAAATDVGTTQANFFSDTTAAPNENYFYWVKSENGTAASNLSASDAGMRAAGMIQTGIFTPLEAPAAPNGNPITAAKAYLGKTLFWDEQLSSTKTVACGTCHRPATGGSDPRTVVDSERARNPGFDQLFNTPDDVFGSPGVPLNNADGTYSMSALFGFGEQVTGRKSPSYLNAAYTMNGLFWDGRATDAFRDPITNAVILPNGASLESQALGPPLSSAEMAHGGRSWTEAAARVAVSKPLALASDVPAALSNWIDGRNYPQLFEEAFGTPDVTPARIAMAIATHERTLFSDRTPFDRWASLIEPLTPQEENGLDVFLESQCAACHQGALLSDQIFHNIGVRPQAEDTGRAVVTNQADDIGKFKTPTLRNVELHAPYMHNGRFATLEDVVEFYNRGGDFDAPNIDRTIIRPLNLTTQQKADLVAFLKRPMTDTRVRDELPPFDRPQLYTESNRVPLVTGTGRAGAGSFVPKPVAIEPPLVGNPSFTVAVSQGLGGAQAVLVIDSSDPGVGASIPATGSFTRQTVTLQGSGAGAGFASISLQIPDNPALVGQTFYGRWYVADASDQNGFAVSQAFRFTVFGEANVPSQAAFVDFDGDRKTDVSIYRPSLGQWWYLRSSNGSVPAVQFGSSADKIVPADFTGDGKTDVAFFRPSTGEWFVLRSEDGSFYAFPFGANGDIPVPADYDGDGRADPAVFRPASATWYLQTSSQGTQIYTFGAATDLPQIGDFDGDGKSDLAIFRPTGANGAEWWIRKSSNSQVLALQFGVSTDKAVASDFTGDGKTDVAFWRPASGEWFVLRSEDYSYYAAPFGANGDVPVPGDYDGDGKTDFAVFRPAAATWYANRSSAGLMIVAFGANTDQPVPSAFVP